MPGPIDQGAGPVATIECGAAAFSPALLLGFALRPLPMAPLQRLLSLAARTMARRHPEVFARLRPLGGVAIAIDATDLPFLFEFRPNAAEEQLRMVRRGARLGADATIRGPLSALLALLQGQCDGDALFFSRTLTIEGDMASVLALRNAIDGAAIDLVADLADAFGRGGPLVERLLRIPLGLAAAAMRDAATFQAAINAPVATEQRLQAAALRQVQNRLEAIDGSLRRLKRHA